MKKRISLFMALLLVLLLCACERQLGGTYHCKSSDYAKISTLHFEGNTVSFSVLGMSYKGTYQIKGETLTLTADAWGIPMTQTYSFSKRGNSIFLDGTEYERDTYFEKADESTSVTVIMILTFVLIGAVFLLMKDRLFGKSPAEGPAQESKGTASASARSIGQQAAAAAGGTPADRGVNASGGAAGEEGLDPDEGEEAGEEAPEPETAPVPPEPEALGAERCCICGARLGGDAVHIAALSSGVCSTCQRHLFVLAKGTEVKEFDESAAYFKSRMDGLDPSLKLVLTQFLSKGVRRITFERNQ